ncbi:MAG: hypothetical protein WBO47_08055 [Gammaproteobacteria bacterium]
MKRLLCLIVLMLPLSAFSADGDPHKFGTYWTVTSVDTKPARFIDYLADLKANYRRSLDMQVADGKVKSYTMFSNVHARDGEPDLWLLVEWNSGADMLDTPTEYFEGLTAKLFGSLDKGQAASIDRGAMRTIMSTTLLREMSFTK